ncbi:hypothetical protein HII31_09904 [Pseudocercospora fuligena]|uniref:Mid2 domain-containing protein n=1 Tax=Pseudocercospora fuligena TaxID=685502 RepID=A0A8H6VFJ3_9PEZI|nr:hypothetical protein HII31_09904 [Pseudocercospora fuligena]
MAIMARKVVPVAILAIVKAVTAINCFLSDGTTDLDQQPCPGVDDNSPGSCCMSTTWPNVDTCMSNGLCLSTVGGYMYTGACTDKDWSSEYCSLQKICSDYYGANYAVVTACYTPQNTPGSMCCGFHGDNRTKDCCANSSGFNFSMDSTTSLFLGPLNASSLLNVTTTVAALDGDGDAPIASESSSSNGTVQTVVPSDYIKSTVAIGVGVGLGVPLLIALASVAWLGWTLKRQKQAYAQAQSQQANAPGLHTSPAPGYNQDWKNPTSPPAELKATNEVQEAPTTPYLAEAPAERM